MVSMDQMRKDPRIHLQQRPAILYLHRDVTSGCTAPKSGEALFRQAYHAVIMLLGVILPSGECRDSTSN
jgi:hypothetical protein